MPVEINRASVRQVRCPPNGCHRCSMTNVHDTYVSLGEPAFVLNAGLELSPVIETLRENDDGTMTVSFHDQVAGAWRVQQQVIGRELILCANCLGSALALIGFGDVTDAIADRDEAREQLAAATSTIAQHEQEIRGLQDALAAGRIARLELEAALASAARNGQHDQADATNDQAAETTPRRRHKAKAAV